jgi:hypothetical protein
MASRRTSSEAEWLAWAIPAAGLITQVLALAVLSLAVWGRGLIDGAVGDTILLLSFLVSAGSGIIGIGMWLVFTLSPRARGWTLALSIVAILFPISYLAFIWYAMTHRLGH